MQLAENKMKGIILGYNDINSYMSCETHWNKLNENNECPQCNGSPSHSRIDFNTDLYVQDINSEDIKSFLIFKRQIATIISINNEDNPESLSKKMEELDGKECTVEYDQPEEEHRSIIPKRLKLSF